MKRFLPWILLAAVPLAVNIFLWKALVIPQKEHTAALRDAALFLRTKPQLEATLSENSRLLAEWEQKGLIAQEPTGALRQIQRLAKECGVQIEDMLKKDEPSPKAGLFKFVPVEFKAAGSTPKLVHWIHAIEAKPGLRVEDWSFKSPDKPGDNALLDMNMKIVLKNS